MDLDEVRTWDIEKLWKFISKEESLPKRIYEEIRFGRLIWMEITDYILGNYQDFPNKPFIRYRAKKIKKKDLYTDIEEREKMAFKWIEKNYPERGRIDPIHAPR